MKYKISALIIDPNHEKHNYNNIKSLKFGEYAEDNFELKILKSDKNILTEIYNFNYFDSIITIGKKETDFKELFNLPFEYRKKWCHIQNFDEKIISDCIINTFKYNINRKNKPTIFSFFTCTYKTEKHKLERLYNSLVNQLYKEWNWFIIDDSPNNDTIDIINSFKDPRITVIKNITHHGNIGFNKHTIAMMCDGDYLIEIDHDDEVTPDCLLYLKNAFEKYPDAKFAYP